MHLEDLVPSPNDPKVLSFCESICPGQRPFCVPVRPEPGSSPLMCFPNVEQKVRISGGSLVHGWEISQMPKIYLEARFHAVWRSPAGQFVCMTEEELGQPRILFLRDDTRKYTGREVPRRRFSLAQDTSSVEKYWFLLDESLAPKESIALGGMRDDPAARAHLASLQSQRQRIRERLQNAA